MNLFIEKGTQIRKSYLSSVYIKSSFSACQGTKKELK